MILMKQEFIRRSSVLVYKYCLHPNSNTTKINSTTFFHVTLRLLVRFSDIMFFPYAFPSFLDIFFVFLSAFLLLSSRYYYSLVSKTWISIVQPTSKCFIDFLIH